MLCRMEDVKTLNGHQCDYESYGDSGLYFEQARLTKRHVLVAIRKSRLFVTASDDQKLAHAFVVSTLILYNHDT